MIVFSKDCPVTVRFFGLFNKSSTFFISKKNTVAFFYANEFFKISFKIPKNNLFVFYSGKCFILNSNIFASIFKNNTNSQHKKKITLKLIGVGYKAFLNEDCIHFQLGFSHIVSVKIPNVINLVINKDSDEIVCTSFDKCALSEFCFFLIKIRPPAVYNSKGIFIINKKFISKTLGFKKVGKTVTLYV